MLHNFIPSAPEGWQNHRAATRAAWGWGEGDVGLVQVGRLHRNKGCDTTLDALALLPPQVKLAFVGEGPEEAALKVQARALGLEQRITFAGWVNEVEKIAAAADIWLAPSRHEPLGNTAIDAWVHGVPLVVSAVGGLDALVEHGVHGLKVPPETQKRWRRQYCAILKPLPYKTPCAKTALRAGWPSIRRAAW